MKNAVRALGRDRLFESFELSLKADGLRPHCWPSAKMGHISGLN